MCDGAGVSVKRLPPGGSEPTRTPGRPGTLACIAILALAASAGCDPVFGGPDWNVRIGTLSTVEPAASIDVPASAVAGEPFTVLVRTSGGGCDRAAGTLAVPGGPARTAIVPSDSVYVGDDVCPTVLRVFEHEARVTFPEPGEKTVRFRVRDPATGSLVEIDRTVQVTPVAAPVSVDDPA